MFWYDVSVPVFCESLLWVPEYVNVFTSGAFAILGFFGLFNKHDMFNYLLIDVFVMLNAFGSAAYHWTPMALFGLLDTLPTIFMVYLSCAQIVTNLIQACSKYWDSSGISHGIIKRIVLVIMCSFMLLAVADESLSAFWGFRNAVTGPICTIIFCSLIQIIWYKNEPTVKYLLVGTIFMVLACLTWILTEPYCWNSNDHWIKYTFSHGFWHVGICLAWYYIWFFNLVMSHAIEKIPYTVYMEGKLRYFPLMESIKTDSLRVIELSSVRIVV